ncbi:MAG: hypothetical protein HYT79_03670 [Elusimicrobia bacterium]|nr:hypothetical protein [Elusimicrobiota bacterium]
MPPVLEASEPNASLVLKTPSQDTGLLEYPQELSYLDPELTDVVHGLIEKARMRQDESVRGRRGWQTLAEQRKLHMACEGRSPEAVQAYLEIKRKEADRSFTPEEIARWTREYGFRPVQDPVAAAVKLIIVSTESGLAYFVRMLDEHHNKGLHLPSMAPFLKYWVADEFDHQLGTAFVMSIQDDLPADYDLEQKAINMAEFHIKFGVYAGPLEALTYATIQEFLTQRTYQQAIRYFLGKIPRLDPLNRLSEEEKRQPIDPFMADYYVPIAQDEGYHHGVFLSALKAHLQNKPDRLALVYDCLRLFKMPGANWPNFQARGALMAAAGLYSPVSELDVIFHEILTLKLDFENLPTPPGSLGAMAKKKIREYYPLERKRRERLETIMKRRVLRAYKTEISS